MVSYSINVEIAPERLGPSLHPIHNSPFIHYLHQFHSVTLLKLMLAMLHRIFRSSSVEVQEKIFGRTWS